MSRAVKILNVILNVLPKGQWSSNLSGLFWAHRKAQFTTKYQAADLKIVNRM